MSSKLASILIVLVPVLVISLLATPASATVGLEYLGPYPLILTPASNQTRALSGSATVGNTGSESAIVTFQLTSKDPDFAHFTARFSVNNFTLPPGQRKEFTLTLTFDPNTPDHSYDASIAIQAKAATGGSGTASFNLPVRIVSQAPDFQINVSPASHSVLGGQGQTVSYTVNIAALNGFNSQVSLTVTGAPSGANTVFSVPSATPNFVSTLTVTLPASAPTGSFTLAITGRGGGVSHLANAILIINQATQTQSSTSSSPSSSTSTSSSSNTETSGPSGPSDLMTIVQQNYLLAIGALILILIAVALVLRGRRKSTAEATAQVAEKRDAMIDSPAEPRKPVARSARKKCPSCGKAAFPNDVFCDRCGRPLR